MKIMRPSTEPPSSRQDGRAAPAQNVVIVPAEPESRYWRNYASESSLLLGIAHIVIGILCIMCNLVAIGAQSPTAVAGHGIWGGAFSVTFVILSILAVSIFVLMIFTVSAVGVGQNHEEGRELARAMDGLMLFLSLCEAVVAIWSAAGCCASVCCGRRHHSDTVLQRGTPMTNAGRPEVLYTTGTSYPQAAVPRQQGRLPHLDSLAASSSVSPLQPANSNSSVARLCTRFPRQRYPTLRSHQLPTLPNTPLRVKYKRLFKVTHMGDVHQYPEPGEKTKRLRFKTLFSTR
ncbi:hypothetical protein NP493_26g06045 [Ridgeia piscesae]|uniref:Uncharacterized protein n=1 Tax=Ridgeia piscesae TaxID=27915 RepID=A0AAD9PDM2_RIDPI|nr:hypothetical protein NP493_26g06045 [Ridgeia piscesae]